MQRFQYIFVSVLFVILLFSCSRGNENILTYSVSQKDFENALVVDGYTEPVRSTSLSCPGDIEGTVVFLVEDGTVVEEGDVVCVIESKDLQNYYDQMLISLDGANASLNKTKAELEMQYALLEAQVKSNEAETQIAQLDSLQLAYSTPSQKRIKELQLKKVGIDKARYEKKLKALDIIHKAQIRQIELSIQNFSNRIKSTKDRLDELTIKAPHKGLLLRGIHPVTGTKLQVGDVIWSRAPIASMPEMKAMKVKIQASESDYKYISINDSVCYTFDAMPGNQAWGKILKKAPVGQAYQRGSKVKFFEIEASVDSTLEMPEPGFTANCRIIMKLERDTIVVPQISIFEEDSMKVVYVKRDNGFEMRQVLTGLTSSKEAVITAGLRNKEIISLSKPGASLIREKKLLPDSVTGNKKVEEIQKEEK